jgi:hypothetical protein
VGLETVNTINELVETWPLQTDKIRQGAGHIRNIKKALKATFVNITAPVTVTAATLNALPADFQALLTELLKHVVPRGAITQWHGSIASIPAGWHLADGSVVAGYGTLPDLRDRFVVGAGNSYSTDAVGGSITKATTNVPHTHAGTTGGTAISVAQMPAHGHRAYMNDTSAGGSGKNLWALDNAPSYKTSSGNSGGNALIEPTGGGQTHDHPVNLTDGTHAHDVADIRPPYYALAYIVKVTAYAAP